MGTTEHELNDYKRRAYAFWTINPKAGHPSDEDRNLTTVMNQFSYSRGVQLLEDGPAIVACSKSGCFEQSKEQQENGPCRPLWHITDLGN